MEGKSWAKRWPQLESGFCLVPGEAQAHARVCGCVCVYRERGQAFILCQSLTDHELWGKEQLEATRRQSAQQLGNGCNTALPTACREQNLKVSSPWYKKKTFLKSI